MMRTLTIVLAVLGVSIGVLTGNRAHTCCEPEMMGGKCNPYGICKACTTCRYCKHCAQNGGTCSVCR